MSEGHARRDEVHRAEAMERGCAQAVRGSAGHLVHVCPGRMGPESIDRVNEEIDEVKGILSLADEISKRVPCREGTLDGLEAHSGVVATMHLDGVVHRFQEDEGALLCAEDKVVNAITAEVEH